MRIDRVAITNHSRVADLDLAVRQHAVIVGANDVGKSSILRMLHLVLGASTAALYQRLGPADLADSGLPLIAEVVFGEFTDEERTIFHSEISVDAADEGESMRVQLRVELDPENDEAVTIRRWFPEGGHERGPTRPQQEALGWRYLPATRGVSASSLDGPESAVRALLQATDLGEQKGRLGELLETFNSELGGSSNIVDLLERVATHLSKAMPKLMAADDIAVRSNGDPESDVLANVTMFLKRDDAHVPLHEQSDGLKQLMSMTLFDLAEGSANVVAIDEPELHLHPSSQRTVADLFATAQNQKFIATHSPYIVHRFQPADVIAVGPDGACHQIADERLSDVEKQQVNWWSPRLLEALTARHAIIVEGPSDRVIVEAAARVLGVGLDRLGAVVLDIDGAYKFPHVYRLLGKNGFGVPVLGLVDEKESGRWVGAIGGKAKVVIGTTIWVSKSDLEDEYAQALTGPGAARALIAAGYCKEADVLSATGAAAIDDITADAAAAYCRKGKTAAATAIASQLDSATAAKITSINGLLDSLQASAS